MSLLRNKSNLVAILLVFVATVTGFGTLLLSLHQEGLRTRMEKLYYLPYQEELAEQVKQDEARVQLKLQTRQLNPGIYENTLEIQTSAEERVAKISEVMLELSAPSDWELISATMTFPGGSGQESSHCFATTERKKEGPNSSILLKAISGAEISSQSPNKGVLIIKSSGSPTLSIWVQKSSGKPLSPIVWTSVPNRGGDSLYASLSGGFRYSACDFPSYSKAQLLAYTWGMGVAGKKIIYMLVVIAFLLFISGIGMLFATELLAKIIPCYILGAIGVSLIYVSICVLFSFIFPPFYGPDEVYHFLSYAKVSGSKSLSSASLNVANREDFFRIHRRTDEKYAAKDIIEAENQKWSSDIHTSIAVTRSPLGIAYSRALSFIISDKNAGNTILQLRVVNGLFVGACLLLALAIAGSIFPSKPLAHWFAAPLLLIPCVAHYSTVISNYPILIGGYVIQMVVLGILWVSLDGPALMLRQFAKIGFLLGLGIGIALCSSDNAMVTLPLWCVILPAFLMPKRLFNESQAAWICEAGVLLGSMIGMLLLFCSVLGQFSFNHSFLPGLSSIKLLQVLPVHGSQFLAGIFFLTIYSAAVCAFTYMLYVCRCIGHKMLWRVPWRAGGFVVLIFTILVLIFFKAPRVPFIDLSRGENTTSIRYAATIIAAFADGLFPGQADVLISETFWRKLGWLDTELPAGVMEFLRNATGLGIFLLMCASLREKSFNGLGLFAIANIIGLIVCVAAIGILYYAVLYNVNSRYILVAYLFATILAAEGYRRVLCGCNTAASCISKAQVCIFILAITLQSWSCITVLNRYF